MEDPNIFKTKTKEYGKTYLNINHHYLFTLKMLIRYCCPLKSLNVIWIIANKTNKQTNQLLGKKYLQNQIEIQTM